MDACLTAVFEGQAGRIALQRLPVPAPQPGETLARVLGCTICGSDRHSFEGRRSVPTPTILGHEIVGEVVAFGPGQPARDIAGRELRIGDRITWAIVAACGECFYCLRDLPQKCLNAVKYGHEELRTGRELVGGLAEYCLLAPRTAVVALADELPLEVACPASCATATVAAALEAAGPVRDCTVLVCGAGMLGLTACAMLHTEGAGRVVCIDPSEERLDRARTFGASTTAVPGVLPDLRDRLTSGCGFDVVLELSGSSAAVDSAWQAARIGGVIVLVGSVAPGRPLNWDPEQIVRRQLTIRGVHNYAPRHLVRAVEFLVEHHQRYPLAELVASWHPLQEVSTAFARSADPAAVRVGVRPAEC